LTRAPYQYRMHVMDDEYHRSEDKDARGPSRNGDRDQGVQPAARAVTPRGGQTSAAEREKRLAAALRDNLRRRKRRNGTSDRGPLAPPLARD
jgi:hypothetical protein